MIRRRWRSKPTGKQGWKKRLFIALLIFMLISLQSMIMIERNLKPPLMNLAKVRVKQMATESINEAISDRVSKGTNFEKLIDWKTDSGGKVTGFLLNYSEHMRITSETRSAVQQQLDSLKELPEHIPLGQAMGSAILASFGPKIPIRLTPAGAVKVDLSTRHENAGINMILVEVYIRIVAEVSVIIPFDSEPEIVETEIPISYSLVVGDVPMYYFDNKGNPVGANKDAVPPNISLPNMKQPAAPGSTGTTRPENDSEGATKTEESLPDVKKE
ncbi:sporulation protein YunB [Paenibacillus sp. FJAT-26967]|uniref:sporulation protein YunB n=1 Tax=Paenibacillus sp. FJAT-26967 TaxID=1729690 RepID=UPI000839A02F|nr:sporulation protein YunB [Paenibacillus sp. FJAT-26967]